jgi:hypothetical protein
LRHGRHTLTPISDPGGLFPRNNQLQDDTRKSAYDEDEARYRETETPDPPDYGQLTVRRETKNRLTSDDASEDNRIECWIPCEGIDFHVISADLQIYLGPDASVVVGTHHRVGAALSSSVAWLGY